LSTLSTIFPRLVMKKSKTFSCRGSSPLVSRRRAFSCLPCDERLEGIEEEKCGHDGRVRHIFIFLDEEKSEQYKCRVQPPKRSRK